MRTLKASTELARVLICIGLLAPFSAVADSAAEMARKLQHPLANIRGLMTDNAVGFETGTTDDTPFAFQLQPVYAIDMPDKGISITPRGNIPNLGLEPGTDIWLVGRPTPGTSSTWGPGDSIVSGFFAPHTESKWKWGVGPQFSIATATDNALEGPGWGAGVAGVLTGQLTSKTSFAGIAANLWGDSGKFNTMTI